jgi:tetratricopeptide (TPR) repeat protein
MFNPTDPAVTTPASVAPASDTGTDEATVSRETLTRRLFRFDMVLLTMVLVLAFFLGSFIATNSDLFLDLALGNPFGADADPSGWPHHAWLPSLVLGSFYEPFSENAEIGGIAAVVAKALVIVILVIVLCRTRRQGQSWLFPVVGSALAVLVMSPRLALQPLVLSFLFLAVTFYVLNLPANIYPRAIWCLPALFLLWVNTDQWFLIGPFTVALFLLGEWLQHRFRVASLSGTPAPPGRLRQLGLVLLVGLAVCLINPWTYRAFTLPLELGHLVASTVNVVPGAGRMVRQVREQDPQFLQQWSPLSSEYWSRPDRGQNAAGLAYFVLLIAGIASFVVPVYALRPAGQAATTTRAGYTLPLLMVFVCLGLLSMWTYRLVPLFAVVAGPIAVLNFQDYMRRRPAQGPAVSRKELNWAVGARGAALLATVVLLPCAWAGWLHGNAGDWRLSRHVGWGVAEDPGIQTAAATLVNIQKYGKEHHQPHLLKLGINYGPDTGNYFAWTNRHGWPGVNVASDARYALYEGERAVAFGKLRRGLRDELDAIRRVSQAPGKYNPSDDLRNARDLYQEALRKLGSDYVIFTNLHRDPLAWSIVQVMQEDPFLQWTPLYYDGRTAVFGWRDPLKRNDPFRDVRLDLTPLAAPASFPPNVPSVTLKPGVPPVPTGSWTEWDEFLTGPVAPPLSYFQSKAYLEQYNTTARQAQQRFQELLAEAGGPAALAGKRVLATFDVTKEPGPPGALLLAVRASRNGVLENPEDFTSYKQLAESCGRSLDLEDYWVGRPGLMADLYKPASLRVRLRQIELLTAMHQALVLQPNKGDLHKNLGDIYLRLSYLDLALEHLSRAGGFVDPKLVQKINEEVKHRQDEFKRTSIGLADPLERFDLALHRLSPDGKGIERRGLLQLGLKILGDADLKKLEGPALAKLVAWQMYLMLMTGQAEAVKEARSENLRKNLPPGEYEELQALAAAALGDYPTADRFLAEAEKAYHLPPDEQLASLEQQATRQMFALGTTTAAWIAGQDGLAGSSARLVVSVGQYGMLFKDLAHLAEPRARVADVRLVRGILALEAGQRGAALKHFQDSLRIGPVVVQMYLLDRAVARRYVEILEGK